MLKQQTTLIVSSDPAARNRAQAHLIPGQAVRQVSTFGEALAILFAETYLDLPYRVIVDRRLPDGTGQELMNHVRNDPWLRRATLVIPLEPPVAVVVPEITDEMVIDALGNAGIP